MGDTTVAIPTRVLVLGMAHEDGTILTEELLPVAAACGLTGDQVRSCLRRLVAEGLFERTSANRVSSGDHAAKASRHPRYLATERGMTALGSSVERTRLAYVQDAAGKGWDRLWRLVAFAVPEKERAARDAFRDTLIELGGAPLQGGLYVSPHPWHKEVAAAAERVGISDVVTFATTDDLEVGGEHDPRRLALQLWPIDDLADAYERFNQRHDHLPALLTDMRARRQQLPDSDFLPAALAMTVAYDECASGDPLLPPELLPRPWPGRHARELLMTSRRLALALRKGQGRPALFRWFDEAIETIS